MFYFLLLFRFFSSCLFFISVAFFFCVLFFVVFLLLSQGGHLPSGGRGVRDVTHPGDGPAQGPLSRTAHHRYNHLECSQNPGELSRSIHYSSVSSKKQDGLH